MCSILRGRAAGGSSVAVERLDDAVEQLDAVIAGSADIETPCTRFASAARRPEASPAWSRPALGDEFRPFDRIVRAPPPTNSRRCATRMRSSPRSTTSWAAHGPRRPTPLGSRSPGDSRREATRVIEAGDERIVNARNLLVEARDRSQEWKLTGGFDRDLRGAYRHLPAWTPCTAKGAG